MDSAQHCHRGQSSDIYDQPVVDWLRFADLLQMAAQGQKKEAVRQGGLVRSHWACKRAVDSQRQSDQARYATASA